MIKVLYFARLAEELSCREESIEADVTNVQALINTIKARGEPWNTTLSNGKVMVAINQTMQSLDSSIADGDEVALFPPVTGG